MQTSDSRTSFRFSIDRGGTFTDIYAEVPGTPGFRIVKLLSEDPANYADAPSEGIRRILAEFGIPSRNGLIDDSCIEWIRMGTTVATNALLERKGARTGLVITRGFGDLLQIGNQDRPRLFDLKITKPDILYKKVIEVDERLQLLHSQTEPSNTRCIQGSTGERFIVLARPDLNTIRPQLQEMLDQGITSLAIVFMHAYACPQHEEMVAELAEELGFAQISQSSKVMPMVKLVSRGDTSMVDAYLTPCITAYLNNFRKNFAGQLKQTNLLFMQSNGGLAKADSFTGCRAILSGPAGGVVGYGISSYDPEQQQPVIGFDMGGTSTDVSRYDGEPALTFETSTAGVRIQSPQLDIKTVAAGGGSRLFFENGLFRVGPRSAGARPGPVCYRNNGYLTITDANLVLGRLQPDYFPKIFGPQKNLPLDLTAARTAMAALTDSINQYYRSIGRAPLTVEQTAQGFLQVANEVMIRHIREVSVMRGFDCRDHILAGFGGAGGQHACAIARSLGITTVVIHRFSGILSACGMGLADIIVDRQLPAAGILGEDELEAALAGLDRLQQQTEQELADQGIDRERITSRRFLKLRYQGTDTSLMIEQPENESFSDVFLRTHAGEFGFTPLNATILIDALRIRSRGKTSLQKRLPVKKSHKPPVPKDQVFCFFDNTRQQIPLYDTAELAAGHEISGPALLIQDTATLVIEPDCTALMTDYGDINISVGHRKRDKIGVDLDPIQLSIFSNLFMSIAEQMGRTLQKTAISTNIKERRDFSCALFDPLGRLVANAPHVPVHLGAMSEAVTEQIRRCTDVQPGDVLLANHPASGGSHLPDITVMTPVFKDASIIFWVACRGHHADIGGISPGSMPPDSQRLSDEGAAILSFVLVRNGVFREKEISALLLDPDASGQYQGHAANTGTRRLSDNLSDLKAQVAANTRGIDLILEMIDHYGLDVVQAYMRYIQQTAETAVRSSLQTLSRNRGLEEYDSLRAVDYLDDGSPIALKITIDRRDGSAVFDFSGTGPELPGNLNAPRAVTCSAILYSLRCLVDQDIPLNHGCMLPITLIIPEGSLLDPSPEAAVVGGNVLTSQRVVDVILKAFGVAAASQGCMNNLTFGNDDFGYYETIGGGAGAGPDWHGQSGIHTHMTNTRITDPEILERRYPVLVKEFSLRRGSGGDGRFQGGDGLIRELEFLAPLNVAILSERRVVPPYGLQGGLPGKQGKNLFINQNGKSVDLGGKKEVSAQPGDRIRILTPGGGGFGISEQK